MKPSPRASVAYYVNFITAVGYFRRCIRSIQERQAVKHAIEWNGGPGLGKTSLITKVMNEICIPGEMFWICINFKSVKSEGKNYYQDPTLLIRDMITSLTGCDGKADISSLEQVIEAYQQVKPSGDFIDSYSKLPHSGIPEKWVEAMNRVCSAFIDIADSIGHSKEKIIPLVLFFDETESIDS